MTSGVAHTFYCRFCGAQEPVEECCIDCEDGKPGSLSAASRKRSVSGIQPDVAENVISRVALEDTAGDMSCGAGEHAAVLQNNYVRTMIQSAWMVIIDEQWAKSQKRIKYTPISLRRIKEHVERETHVPVTAEMLLYEEPQNSIRKKSWSL